MKSINRAMSSFFERRPHRGVVERQIIAASLIQGFGMLLIFGQQFLLARWLGAEGFGKLSYGLSVVNILAIIAGMGLPVLVLRFIPEYMTNFDIEKTALFVKFTRYATVLGGVVVTFALAIISYSSRGTSIKGEILLFAVPLLLPLVFVSLKQETLRAFKNIQLSLIPSILIRPMLIILGSLCILMIGKMKPETILLVFALANISAWVILNVSTAKILGKNNIPSTNATLQRNDLSLWISVSMTMLGILLIGYMQNQIDLVIIGISQTAQSTGLYSLAMKLALLVSLPLVITNNVFAPRFVDYFTDQKLSQLQSLICKLVLITTGLSLSITLIILLFGKQILGFFGEEFSGAYIPMAILVMGQIVNVGAGPAGILADLSGLQMMSFVARLIVLILAVGLYIFFVPLYGMVGAAMITSLTTMLWNVWLHEIVRRKHGINSSFFWALKKLIFTPKENQ